MKVIENGLNEMRLSQFNRFVICPFDMNTDIVVDMAFVFNIGIVSNDLTAASMISSDESPTIKSSTYINRITFPRKKLHGSIEDWTNPIEMRYLDMNKK